MSVRPVDIGMVQRMNDVSQIKHNENSKIKIGETNSLKQKGELNSQYGTCWVTKEGEYKKIKKELLEDYINDGWIKGRK